MNALADTLSQEVAGFGIKVTIIEPGPYATDFSGASLVTAKPLPHYAEAHARMAAFMDPATHPDPGETIKPLMRAIDTERPPLHLLMVPHMPPMAERIYAERLESIREGVALSA